MATVRTPETAAAISSRICCGISSPLTVARPNDRKRHLPRRVPRARHSLLVERSSRRSRRLRRFAIPPRYVRLLLDSSALLAAKALHGRPARPVTHPNARRFSRALPAAGQQLRRRACCRWQARDLNGRLQRPRGGLRPPRLPHQADRLRVRIEAAYDRHHPLQPWSQQRQEGLPLVASSRACTMCA